MVYKINCNDCDSSYVGVSKSGIGVRVVKEHKPDSKKAHKETAFLEHVVSTDIHLILMDPKF